MGSFHEKRYGHKVMLKKHDPNMPMTCTAATFCLVEWFIILILKFIVLMCFENHDFVITNLNGSVVLYNKVLCAFINYLRENVHMFLTKMGERYGFLVWVLGVDERGRRREIGYRFGWRNFISWISFLFL